MLETVKNAMWLTTNIYDSELLRLIGAAVADLGIAGLDTEIDTMDSNYTQAIVTYCRLNFGSPEDWERLKRSYDEQKAQLMTATGYGLA